jgi:hypothetical protein
MSAGPDWIERALREVIDFARAVGDACERKRASLRFSSEELCGALYGPPPWTHGQATSALRAMRRIVARQEGWRSEIGKGHRVAFIYERPADRVGMPAAQRSQERANGTQAETPRRASTPVQPDVGAAGSPTPVLPVARPYAPGAVNLPTAGAALKSATTVCVACKLPGGLVLRIQEVYEHRVAAPGGYMVEKAARDVGPTFILKGVAHPPNRMPLAQMEGGYALTFGIPAEF